MFYNKAKASESFIVNVVQAMIKKEEKGSYTAQDMYYYFGKQSGDSILLLTRAFILEVHCYLKFA